MNRLIMDLDNTIAGPKNESYMDCAPDLAVVQTMRHYKDMGFKITIFTSRNMRTFRGNVGQINAHTLPVISAWLAQHEVPYDEILVGKPWCGPQGFYVDDRAVRPDEFVSMPPEQIQDMLKGPVSGNEAPALPDEPVKR